MPAPRRAADCTRADALARLKQAKSFIEVADLVLGSDDELALPQVSASLAVLSGIASSDAVCCARLGRRSRSRDHREAITLRESVPDSPKEMTHDLRRLLDLKDGAHYSSIMVTLTTARDAVRRARRLYLAAVTLVR